MGAFEEEEGLAFLHEPLTERRGGDSQAPSVGRVPGSHPSLGDGVGANPVLLLPLGLQSSSDPPAPRSTGTNKGWAPPARPLQLNQPAVPLPTRRLPAPGTRGAQRSAAPRCSSGLPSRRSKPPIMTAISAMPSMLIALHQHRQSRRAECIQEEKTEDKRRAKSAECCFQFFSPSSPHTRR